MNSEDNFKQSLRSLLESKEFPFEEKDWDKALLYMNKQRAGSKWRRLGILVVALGGALSLILISRDQAPANDTRITAAASGPASEILLSNDEATAPFGRSVNSAQRARPELTATPKLKKNPAPAKGESERTNGDQTKAAVEPPIVSSQPVSKQLSPEVSLTLNKVAKAKEEEEREANDETPERPLDRIAVPVKPAEPVPVNEKKEETVQNPPAATEATLTPGLTARQTSSSEQEAPLEEKNGELVTAGTTATTAALLPGQTVPDSIKAKVPRLMLLSCELGTSFTTGWKNESGRDATGFNPIAGISYMTPIDTRFTMSFGIQYQRTGHLSSFSHTSKSSKLSFGEESEVLVITPARLHYLAVPLRLYYSRDQKNTFGAGYTIAYLLDVESNVESYTLKVGKESNNKTYVTRGYTDGFSLFDSQLSLFYRRHLYGNFSLHGEAFLGLNDVKQDGFFGGNSSQRTSGFKFMLIYAIFDRNK